MFSKVLLVLALVHIAFGEKRLSETKCEEYTRDVVVKSSGAVTTCAYKDTDLLLGGDTIHKGVIPHLAQIGWKTANGTKFVCGGSLISPRFVLTAAHCTSTPGDGPAVLVRVGDSNDPGIPGQIEEIPIKSIIRHPSFKPPQKYNDIALIELARDATLSGQVRPACLSTGEIKRGEALITGWGPNFNGDDLQKTQLSVQVLTNEECSTKIPASRHLKQGLAESMLCYIDPKGQTDTCKRDSGYPVHTVDFDRCVFTVLGATTFGVGCGGERPVVATRVNSYLDWIERVVWN